jgi:hypothetical protein
MQLCLNHRVSEVEDILRQLKVGIHIDSFYSQD